MNERPFFIGLPFIRVLAPILVLAATCQGLATAGPAEDEAADRAYQAAAEAHHRGDCAGAQGQYRVALALLEKVAAAPGDPRRLSVLLNLAFCEHDLGAEQPAHDHLKQVLPELDKALRSVVPASQLVLSYDLLAKISNRLALWDEELAALRQTLAAFKIDPAHDPLDEIDVRLRESIAFMRLGRLEDGRSLRQATLQGQAASPKLADELPGTLNTLGNNLANAGFADDAVEVFDQLIARLGREPSMPLGVTYFNKAVALRDRARWDEVIEASGRAAEILERTNGPNDERTLNALGGLGQGYDFAGGLAPARQWLRIAYERAKVHLGSTHPSTTLFANNLANVHRELGDTVEAERLDREALAVRLLRFGEDSQDTQASRRNLAVDLQLQGRHAAAAGILQPLLDRLVASLGTDHPETWGVRAAIAGLEMAAGDLDAAERRYADIRKPEFLERLPPQERVSVLNALATFAERRGRADEALALHERSYREARATLGPDHFDTLTYFANLLAMRAEDPGAQQAADIADLDARVVGWASREVASTGDPLLREKLIALFRTTRNLVVGEAAHHPGAESLALLVTAMERWKGIGLREDRLLAQLSKSSDAETARLARLIAAAGRGGAAASASALNLVKARATLVDRSPAYAEFRRRGEVTAADLAAALRPGEVLLDYWVIPASAGGARDSDQVVAALVGPDGVRSAHVLGAVGPLASVSGARGLLSVPAVAAAVYTQFLQPFEAELQGADKIYVAPDGPLHLVPFEALRTPRGRYLVEEREITTVRDGKSLIAARRGGGPSRSGIIVVDDIDYGKSAGGTAPFGPLGGADARAILPVLKNSAIAPVEFVRGKAATKSWIMSLSTPPRILHLSTHGSFASGTRGREDALGLSLIALAGANVDYGRGDSGVLTAAEVTRVKLTGTDLVVLSACETAQGEATYSEGLAGLSSALAIAGARRSLLALWPVSNNGAAAFMRRFYEHLVKAPDSYEAALRATKLDAIGGSLRLPPGAQDWKAFVLVRN
jgi:tetratricopeptide (TPR) repeat protein